MKSKNESISVDLGNACIWQGPKRYVLRPKDIAVLHVLAERPGCLVSKAVLLDAVWPETYVDEGVLKNSIRRLRQALQDEARTPRFIETVHGHGYRLIGEIDLRTASPPWSAAPSPAYPVLAPPCLVGREDVSVQMQGWLARIKQGSRQMGFVSGEAGMGKTTVVEAFVAGLSGQKDVQLLDGRCIERYGLGEAYLPLLEALQQGCRGPHGERYLTVLRRHAPTWLLQFPGLLDDSEYETLQRLHAGSSRERMLREMAEALEALASERPLVLILEDLHWSDVATLDLLALLAQRRQPARLLVLGTYRPEDLLASAHPLQAVLPTLRRHPRVDILSLMSLTEAEVGAYLSARFPMLTVSAKLTHRLHRRSGGNPLFLVTLVDHLVEQGEFEQTAASGTLQDDGAVCQAAVPDTLQQMIMQRRSLCSPQERRVLAAASVVGLSFSAASVAAALDADLIAAEAWCAELVRRGLFLRHEGEAVWPDGTVATQYGFRHVLYQQVLYEQIPAAQRVQFHRRIAEREEQGYGERVSDIAARLALHIERGHNAERAVDHDWHVANTTIPRYAYHEAINNCRPCE